MKQLPISISLGKIRHSLLQELLLVPRHGLCDLATPLLVTTIWTQGVRSYHNIPHMYSDPNQPPSAPKTCSLMRS